MPKRRGNRPSSQQVDAVKFISEDPSPRPLANRITKQQQNYRGPGTDPMNASTIKPGQEGGIPIPRHKKWWGTLRLSTRTIPED
jgi:hypothetical protein